MPTPRHQIAQAVLLVNRAYALQLRDDVPGIAARGMWALFGGALEEGESPEAALRREIFEELRIRVTDCRLLWQVHRYSEFWGAVLRYWFFFADVTPLWPLHVVKAMGSLQNDTSFQVLKSWIERKDDLSLVTYRDGFVESLGDHPRREEAVDLFVDRLQDDDLPSTHTRNKSAQALGKIRSPETLPDLYSAIQKERHWVVKQTLLGSVGKIGNPESVPFLVDVAMTARESAVRLSAAGALRRIGTPQAMQALQEAARSEDDPEVKKRLDAWAAGREN
jgi:ADP-ribose pyrophosphatase YjhB (NUDIX family)